MQQSSIDPPTGQIDMDVIQTGRGGGKLSSSARLSVCVDGGRGHYRAPHTRAPPPLPPPLSHTSTHAHTHINAHALCLALQVSLPPTAA